MTNEQLTKYLIDSNKTIIDAMEMIDRNAAGFVFVVDESLKLVGCLTDGDIRRGILKSGNVNLSIVEVMTTSPYCVKRDEVDFATSYMRERDITAVPVVDDEKKVIDIILLYNKNKDINSNNSLHDVPVVIMAGGKGTRLYPYTKILPKPLIPIGDTPIIERIMRRFKEFGVSKYYVTVNYKKEMIKSYFMETDLLEGIVFIDETVPLGTGGSLKLLPLLEKPIIVSNCDSIILTDYSALYDYHKKSGNTITMVSALKKHIIPYGVINFGEEGEIVSMVEKPVESYFINTGMYVVNPDVIDLIPDDTLFHMTHLVERVMEKGGKVGTYPVSEDSFLDMGEFDEMKRMESKLNVSYE